MTQAFHWLEMTALEGDTSAMKELVYIYQGNIEKKLENREKMIYWLEKAADAGQVYSEFYLGNLYFYSKDEKEKPQSFYWFERSAKHGYGLGMNNLGECYYIGLGTPKDYEKARYYYQQAIDHDCAFAKISLGTLYLKGHGVEKDKEKARQLYEAACRENIPEACTELNKLKK